MPSRPTCLPLGGRQHSPTATTMIPDLRWPTILPFLLVLLGLSLAVPAHGFWPFSPEPPRQPTAREQHRAAEKEMTAFLGQIDELARQLVAHLPDRDPDFGPLREGLAVCSFVELKKLTRTSSLGRYLSEQLMTEFQQHGITVTEIRKTNDILVQERRGEYGLSRDPASIGASVTSGATLTGTYTLTEHHVLVNARIIDARTGNLLSSGSTRIARNRLTDNLLADRASAETETPGEIYLKRL